MDDGNRPPDNFVMHILGQMQASGWSGRKSCREWPKVLIEDTKSYDMLWRPKEFRRSNSKIDSSRHHFSVYFCEYNMLGRGVYTRTKIRVKSIAFLAMTPGQWFPLL